MDPFIQAEAPRPGKPPEPVLDPSIIEGYLEDASGNAPGRAAALLRVSDESEAALYLRETSGRGVKVLPQAARSSLTGGAVPDGEVVISVERMGEIGPVIAGGGGARVTAGPGARLDELQKQLGDQGWYYPPVPTYQEAMLGGTVSTNAGGAATFKYGVTRQWIRALRVLLFNGDAIAVERGQAVARRGGRFHIGLSDGRVLEVPVPDYRLPDLKKISAGYFASDPLDLVDLFIGSEGTLGLITSVTIDLVPAPPAVVTGLVFVPSLAVAIGLAGELREAATRSRLESPARGPDVRAIELLDGRCLDLVREHGDARRLRVGVPDGAGAALLFEMEIPEPISNDTALDTLGTFLENEGRAPDLPLVRLFRILKSRGVLETLELALPEDTRRREALRDFRESVPKRVNEILAARRHQTAGVHKVGGDLIVAFEHVADMIRIYEEGFSRRGVPFAIWGHVSDGNLHPNALPRTPAEARLGIEALFEFADEVVRRNGSPLSEHGVGRSPVKQEMLRRFLGDTAIESMRSIKRALDPDLRFAPGVLFPVASHP